MKELMNTLAALKSRGRRVIGCFPLYPPLELLHSFGLTPVTLWGIKPEAGGLLLSDRHLQNFTCGVARCMTEVSLGAAADCFEAFFMYNACDTLRNLPEIVDRGLRDKGLSKPVFRLHVPVIAPDRPGARPYLEERIARLVRDLAAYTGRPFSPEAFVRSAALYRKQRELSVRIEACAAAGRLSFHRCAALLQRAHHLPVEEHVELLERELAGAADAGGEDRAAVPVMISGIQIGDMGIVKTMEESGLRIAANDVATLRRSYGYSPEVTGDPAAYYADFYFNHYPCTTLLSRGDRRIELFMKTLGDSGVRGVIFLGEKFCEYEYFEMPYVEDLLKARGIQALRLEIGVEDSGDPGAVRNRLTAFAEMLTVQAGV